jgi:hypothetical protein
MPGGPIDVEMGVDLVIHSIALAERQTAQGVDGSGAPVEAWANLLAGLPFPATVWLRPQGVETFGQAAQEYEGKVYIPPLTLPAGAAAWIQDNLAGTLPDLRIRDRLTYGVWPENGQPRQLIVAPAPAGQKTLNPVENFTLLVLWVVCRAPA